MGSSCLPFTLSQRLKSNQPATAFHTTHISHIQSFDLSRKLSCLLSLKGLVKKVVVHSTKFFEFFYKHRLRRNKFNIPHILLAALKVYLATSISRLSIKAFDCLYLIIYNLANILIFHSEQGWIAVGLSEHSWPCKSTSLTRNKVGDRIWYRDMQKSGGSYALQTRQHSMLRYSQSTISQHW